MWDIENRTTISLFKDYEGDVLSIATNPLSNDIFASCGADCLVRLTDIRSGKSQVVSVGSKFDSFESDVTWYVTLIG